MEVHNLPDSRGSLIRGVARIWRYRFLRFLIVGGLNTVFGYGVFAALILLKVHYAIASFLATAAGILFNFKTYGTLVFESHENSRILRFFIVYGITYLAGLLPLGWGKAHHVSLLIVAAIIALPMAAFSFFLNRRFVFGGATGRGS